MSIGNWTVFSSFMLFHSLHGKAEHQAIAVLTAKSMPSRQALIIIFSSLLYMHLTTVFKKINKSIYD